MAERFGDYQLLKRLGTGATAEVYLASGPTPSGAELLALKVMLEHLTIREEHVRAFMKEARTSSLLRHPNLVEVYLVGEAEGRPFLAMELVRGWSLSALGKRLRAVNERLSVNEAAELVRQAALGLHFAHQATGKDGEPLGLVHRDVSPQNVMVTEEGVAKVVDFGLAKATLTQETATGTLKGKLKYMPPEQLKSQPIDRRADVFALGAVLWELVCGGPLYPGPSEAEVFQQALFNPQPHPDEVQKGLPRALVELLKAAVERSLDKRTPTAAALAEALAPLSSPDARERLAARIGALFEPFPRSLAEARGEAPRPLSQPRRPRPVLGPPTRGKPELPEPSTSPALSHVEEPTGSHEVTAETDALTGPVVFPPEAAAASSPTLTAMGEPSQVTALPEPSQVTNPDGFPSLTMADAEVPPGLKPPSRRVLLLSASGAVGIVVLGAVIGALVRTREPPAPFVPTPTRPVTLLTADAGAPSPEPSHAPEPGAAPAPTAGPSATSLATGPRGPGAGKGPARRMGALELTSNVPAMVREREVDLGITPLNVFLPAGRHRLLLATPDGSMSLELDVNIPLGGTVKKTARLTAGR